MTAPIPDPPADLWERAEEEQRFWDEHYEELRSRHPDQFVAVVDGEVVATGRHLADIERELKAQGLRSGDAWLRFMAATHRIVAL